MANKHDIKIISAPLTVVAQKPDYLPREGEGPLVAEPHLRIPFFTEKPVEHLTSQIQALKGKIGVLVKALGDSFTDNAELDEVTVGLAVSVEGDIGIASAGAEASIELKFRIKH